MKLYDCIAVTCLVVLLGGCDSNPDPGTPAPNETQYVITADKYENNRFFRLDLPVVGGASTGDMPGRDAGQERIRFSSIHVFKLMPPGTLEPVDIANVAAYLDTTGVFWTSAGSPANDFQTPVIYGTVWRDLTFEPILSAVGGLDGIDLGTQMGADDVLAICYAVEDPDGNLLYSVGDNPELGSPTATLPGEQSLYYRLKLLKAPEGVATYSFGYVMRNFYSLGQTDIDFSAFSLAIVRFGNFIQPDRDESGILYIRTFGLDQYDIHGAPGHDGLVDVANPVAFDFSRGLLRFPMDEPFNAGEATYAAFADSAVFIWDQSYLAGNQAPQLYDPRVPAANYPYYARFVLKATYPTGLEN